MDAPTFFLCIMALIFVCAFAGLCLCSGEISQDDKHEQERRIEELEIRRRKQRARMMNARKAVVEPRPYYEGLEDHSRAYLAERFRDTTPQMPTGVRYGIVGSGDTPHIGEPDIRAQPGLNRNRRSTSTGRSTSRSSDDYVTPITPVSPVIPIDTSPSYSAPSVDHGSSCHSPSFDSSPSTDCGGGSVDCGGGGCDF